MFLQKWPCSAGVAPGDLALDWLLRGSVATLPHLSAFVYGNSAILLNDPIVEDALSIQVVEAPLVFCDNARWGEDPKVGHLSASSFPALGNCQKFFGVRVGDTALVRQFDPQLTRHNFPAGTSEERPHIGPLSALDGTASSYATFWPMYNLAPRSYSETRAPGGKARGPALLALTTRFVGRSARIRTPDRRFWRPLLYQAELRSCVGNGAPGGTRTPDALLRTEALYPLSYRGMVEIGGFILSYEYRHKCLIFPHLLPQLERERSPPKCRLTNVWLRVVSRQVSVFEVKPFVGF